MTMTTPTTMPIIAPVLMPDLELEETALDVGDLVEPPMLLIAVPLTVTPRV